MRYNFRPFASVLVALSLTGLVIAAAAEPGKKKSKQAKPETMLFDGSSLAAWDCHLVDANVRLEDVWTIQDGTLICKGEPLGYLHTKNDYQDFRLTLEWRWAPGKEPGNSGVLLRATGEPVGFMPKCAEAQLKHGSAGDIWGFFGFQAKGPQERVREVKGHEALGDFAGVAAMKNLERAPGEWNTYQIVLRGDKLMLSVNGEKVNEATGCDVVAGKIGLQSEGGEIHFRNIKLVPLD